MPNRLSGKVAIITGGSTGIGKGIAKVFINEGAKVVICSRNQEQLANAVKEIGSENIAGIKCDVTKSDQVKNLVSKTVEKFGKLNVLVNNAGMNPARMFTIEDATEEEWELYQGINAKGSFLASKFSIPQIRKSGGGSIIMISSISAKIGQPDFGVYNCSKAAQEGLVRAMAVDFAKDKIRVNAICPGAVYVASRKKEIEETIDYLESIHPIGRIGTPEDIAWAAVYLASDESTWVTGASFAIDGGYTAV